MEGNFAFCAAVYLIVTYIIYKLLDTALRWPRLGQLSDRYVLVTGCGRGFGYAITRRLDSLGCRVFAACRRQESVDELRRVCSDRVTPLVMDVSDPKAVRRAYEFVRSALPPEQGLWAVVNNAGVSGLAGPNEWLRLDDYKQVLDVNLFGQIDVTTVFLPLIKQARGRVVSASSMAGRVSPPLMAPYCVSKFALEAYMDNTRRSLHPYGCKTVLIEPGSHITGMVGKEYFEGLIMTAWKQASPESRKEFGYEYLDSAKQMFGEKARKASDRLDDVVDAYEHALFARYPRARYVVGRDARLLWWPLSVLPDSVADCVIRAVSPVNLVPRAADREQPRHRPVEPPPNHGPRTASRRTQNCEK